MATLMKMPTDHVPVLTHELVTLLDPQPGELAVDCTFGGGGHARAIAERLGPSGTLIAIDRDPVAGERFEELNPELECEARFIQADFAAALEGLAAEGVMAACIWMDLGISSLQLDDPERGFSYASDAPLDMRMDPSAGTSARDAVNDWPEERLAAAIRDYGEERHARAIAREIARRRPLATTAQLVDAIRAAIPPAHQFGRGHPAKRTFQALRIAVNRELELLDAALPLAWDMLAVGGRFAAISFHSLEDRRVKRFLADRARDCICPPELPVCQCGREPEGRPLTRKPVAPSPEEAERNPRSRSAHLRATLKLGERREPPKAGG